MKYLALKALAIIIALSVGWQLAATPVMAGTDLNVICDGSEPDACEVSPNQPLFNESNLVPGETRFQTITVVNNDLDDTCNLNLTTNPTAVSAPDLNGQLFAALTDGGSTYFGSVSGSAAASGYTHQQLFADVDGVSLGSVAPSSSRSYTWYATFNPLAGNEFQGKQTGFDFTVGLSCDAPPASPGPSSSPGPQGSVQGATTDGGGGGGGGTGGPVCTATAPGQAPVLSITGVTNNTVTLSWNQVSDAHTHYALFFTRDDGATYGSPNIGNVTSYTVSNLAGGRTYTFEILAVNDCAPGPRSNASTSNNVPGGAVVGGPTGPGGEALGVQTETPADATPAAEGSILGSDDTPCQNLDWRQYLLWLLLAQAVVVLAVEFMMRARRDWPKYMAVLAVTIASIAIFYWLRQCNCFAVGSWLSWLCQWYWVAAVIITGALRIVSYAFIEEVSDLAAPPRKPGSTPPPTSA